MKNGAQGTRIVVAAALAMVFVGIIHSSDGADLVTATNWSGTLGLVLDNGVRFRTQRQTARSDLSVDFICRDGRWEQRAWAWFDRMPALEHVVTLTGAEGDAETLKLDFLVNFTSHAPVFAGGSGRYTVELRRALGVIRGDFTGRLGPLDEGVSTNFWSVYRGYALGSTQKPEWPMGIGSGRVCSLRGVGATVHAEIGPLPRAVPGHEPVRQGEHPRLLARQRDAGESAARFAAGTGASVTGGLEKVLQRQRGEWWNCAGSEAAGWAILWQIGRDEAMAAKAAASARDAMEVMRANPHSMVYGRNLAGVSLAYDLCFAQWPEDFRKTVCKELAVAALRLAACLPRTTKTDALLAPGQLFDGIVSSYDYRLGYMRAAAGLALLAIESDIGCDVSAERLAAADAAISGTVRRLLRDGIGEHGEGTGNYGYADLLEVLFPYLQAYKSVRGCDLAAGTGAERVGLLGIATKGACLQRGNGYPSGAWVPFAIPLAAPEISGCLCSAAAKMECRFDDPWHGAIAAVNWPRVLDGLGANGGVPAILEDQAMGSYVLGGGGNADRFVYFRGGAGPDQAAAIRGDVCLHAFGREWMASHAANPGDFSWPNARNCNTINLAQENRAGQRVAIVPRSAGYIDRIRFDRAKGPSDGSGSVCMRADAEGVSPDRAMRGAGVFGLEGGGLLGGAAWRTVGADFSGASGAEVLLVIVEGCFVGNGDADCYWEMDTGSVSADRVVTGPGTFLVRPSGTNATMQGTFIHPGVVDVTYAPPEGTRGGRIRGFLNTKTTSKDLSLDHAIRTKAFGADVDADLRTVDEAKGDERRDLSRQRLSAAMQELLRRESYSAGGLGQLASNACVVVLTVQQGEPPRIEPAPKSGGYMAKVGEQTVFYEDSVIVFGR